MKKSKKLVLFGFIIVAAIVFSISKKKANAYCITMHGVTTCCSDSGGTCGAMDIQNLKGPYIQLPGDGGM